MEWALAFRVEHPRPRRRARPGREPRQVPLDRDTQLLLIAFGTLCERDGSASSKREQSALDLVPAANEPAVERELRRPEGEQQELSVMVEGYLPRLAARTGAPTWTGMLYAKGQSPFHAAVSFRYFELLLGSMDA